MATTDTHSKSHDSETALIGLEPGDHLDQATFHARYESVPDDVSAELVGGIVFMPAALRFDHGEIHTEIMGWLSAYKGATPGTRAFDNASVILADDSEPQPDASLIIRPECGGQTTLRDGYICGPPELVVEVALSSAAYDLHAKRRDYEKYGVGEYLVLVLREQRAVWFVREGDAFTEMPPSDDGLLRSRLFGGLWLDPAGIFAWDTRRVHEVLGQGLASDDHRRTVKRLGTAE